MNEAYKKRDLNDIKERLKKHSRFLQFQNKLKYKKSNFKINQILIYPEINSIKRLADIINRISFAVPMKQGLNIFITVNSSLINKNILKLKTPEYQGRYIGKNKNIFLIDNSLAQKHLDSDYILIHDVNALKNINILRKSYKLKIIDIEYFSDQEAENLRSFFFNCLEDQEKKYFLEISKNNYAKMLEKHKNKDISYCFTTGPSFDKYKNLQLKKNSFKIVCNSIVKNIDFIDYIDGVDLLVFADPVFHFGPSIYTNKFLKDVVSLVNIYDTYIVIPENSMPLLLAHFPKLKNNLIGIRIGRDFNIPSVDNFYIKGSANILTLFMIPIASAVSKNIFIIGADGRKKEEMYFWKHNKEVQYNNEMEGVFKTHPSFFRDRDYSCYYLDHCDFLEELLQYGEGIGYSYFSLTKSFIPALSKRQYKYRLFIKIKRFLIDKWKKKSIDKQFKVLNQNIIILNKKIWIFGKIISKKIKLYWLFQPIVKFIKKSSSILNNRV